MTPFLAACALALAGCSTSSTPSCAPAENLDAGAGYSQSELPSGACSSQTTCGYLVERPCASGPILDRWSCTCDGTTWSCAVTAAATTICLADAGPD